MDGPNVNLKFYVALKQEHNENLFHSLIDICMCSLRSVHRAIRSGVETTFCSIMETLTVAFHLLHDSPARCENFEMGTSSIKHPLYFCATRWVENKVVADRLLEIWTNMRSIIKFWNKLPKYKQPSCQSFDNVKKAVTDPKAVTKAVLVLSVSLLNPT